MINIEKNYIGSTYEVRGKKLKQGENDNKHEIEYMDELKTRKPYATINRTKRAYYSM